MWTSQGSSARDPCFHEALDADTCATSNQIAQFAKRRVLESGKAMLAMSTPVTSVWEGVLLLPLVGVVDSRRCSETSWTRDAVAHR